MTVLMPRLIGIRTWDAERGGDTSALKAGFECVRREL